MDEPRFIDGWWVGPEVSLPDDVVAAWREVVLWPEDPLPQAGWPAVLPDEL